MTDRVDAAARLRELPARAVPDPDAPTDQDGSLSPIRAVTRQIAFDPGGWTPQRAAKIAELFDGLAPQWGERSGPQRRAALTDALERGEVHASVCVEVGSGTGTFTEVLARRFETVLAVDLSPEMLRRAPATVGTRLWADAARLPLGDGSVDAVVLVNMFLFADELARVLRPGGAVVWVSSLGPRTPIYLAPVEVLEALGPGWSGVASAWGEATWCVARR